MKLPPLRKLLKPASAATPTKTLEELLNEAQRLIDHSRSIQSRVADHVVEVEDYADIRGAIAEFEVWVTSHQPNPNPDSTTN